MPSAFLTLALMISGVGSDDEAPPQAKGLELIFEADFSKGKDGWSFTDPAAWRIVETPEGPALEQSQPSEYAPAVRSPVNIALIEGLDVDELVLEVWARSTTRDYDHRDVCLFFGHKDPSHFYYSHIAKAGDEHAHSIFAVDGEPRVSIATERTNGVEWGDGWHRLVLVRRSGAGSIEVYFDDLTQPIQVAEDHRFTNGRLGVGTFDDTAQFRSVRVWGRRTGP